MTTILSGIENLDAITGGFHPGELVLICGRPCMGKSLLLERIMLNTAQAAVRDKKPEFVLYFSLEKWGLQGIPRFRGIRNLQSEAVIVDNTPAVSVEYVAEKFTSLKKTHKISLIAIDYLQLMMSETPPSNENRRQKAADIVSSLKELGEREQVCIMLTSGLLRNVDERPGHLPRLSYLAYIGAIEPLVDMIILLHRPYNSVFDKPGSPLDLLPGPTTVNIAKNRHGNIGICELPRDVCIKSDMFSWRWHKDKTELHYVTIRYHLRWLFFDSPNPDDGPRPDNYEHNGYVINGFRMDALGFASLNATLRWPIAADDPLLDHEIHKKTSIAIPEQYNAFCPLDGYVTAINAEYHWRLPQGEHLSDEGPDSVYRLCPHCLMELASKMEIRRCIRSID